MNRTSTRVLGALGVCAAAALGVTLLTGSQATARAQGLDAGLGRWSINGNLTVELRIDPTVGNAALEWQGVIPRVDEVTIFDEYAVLRRRDVGKTGILIVPREKILWLSVTD